MLRRVAHELRFYNPAADEYKGKHVHKYWSDEITKAIAQPSQAGDDLRDAKRYRFLRYRMNSSAQFLNEPGEILSEQYLDAAIDAAINAKERT